MQGEILKQRYGTWVLITGASDGIGRAFALEFARHGFNVALVSRRQNVLDELALEIEKKYAVGTLVIAGDLSDDQATNQVLAKIASMDIGIAVASAGYGTSGRFIDSDIVEELQMIDVNCRALVQLTHGMARKFAARGRGAIVLMSSLVAFQGVPRAANYAATKAFVQTFAEGLRVELRDLGVEVLAVAPGPVSSGFAARANMRMSMSQTPQEVAIGAIAALGKKGTVRPGFLAKFLESSLAPLPRWGRTRIMQIVMRQMTQHQGNTAAANKSIGG